MLEWMGEQPEGATQADLAGALRLPKNSVFRILGTLEAYGYVFRDGESKHYRMTPRLLHLAFGGLGARDLVAAALPVLRRVAERTRETALVAGYRHGVGTVLDQVLSPQAVKVSVDVGHRFPLHTSAPGKAILAALPREELDEYVRRTTFRKLTPRTLTTAKALRAELEDVRQCGYGLERGEETDDYRCAGAVVLDHRNYPIGAIWVTGPRFRMDDEEMLRRMGGVVRGEARGLSRQMGAGD
jgi:IclR family acetate operon transcriptional repressor